MKLNDIIPIIIKNVNIDSILLNKNYQYVKEKNIGNLLYFKKETKKFTEVLYVGYIDGIQNYFSPTLKDKGNIINFLMNRVDKDPDYTDENGTFNPYKNNLVEAIKLLKSMLIEREIKKTAIQSENINAIDFENTLKNFFTLSHFAQPLFYFKYLEKENIKKETTQSYLFTNKIFNVKNFKEDDYSDPYMLSFPLYLNDKECGLYFSGSFSGPNINKKELSFFASNSNKSGIWYSNKMNLYKLEKEIICLVSNPKEALAHYQYLDKERSYMSVFNLSSRSIKALRSRINNRNYEIHLALNSTIDEISKEVQIIIAFHKELERFKFLEENDKFLKLTLVETDLQTLKKLLSKIKSFNDFIIKVSVETLGQWSKMYVTDSLINLTKNHDGAFLIKIPRNKKSLYNFNKIITSLYTKNVKLEKPRYTSWTNQLELDKNSTISFEEKIKLEYVYQ